ncbi:MULTISPECIES: SusC/RagA family TonB-linked outer membrane protein [Cellulophaga]|uniref:SusC/RagA family TonB-linked outer membrane protein n=1 Tax=Cellulophaga TaxID=104264 RepID=UPI0020902A31|nr:MULTISPECIES: TonB-dependent receptor [Cellulophaga]MDO6769281.1 TonB-dependent receptor [Cellulophaga sp. 1_MG-2023]
MKNFFFKDLIFPVLLFVGGIIHAQTITGIVSDETGPIPGVNVVVKGTSTGTVTDFDGNFEITSLQGDILVFSYVGYLTQEINIAGKTTVNITLSEDAALLEEVVVVGYGTKKKSLVTGAISSISSEDIQNTSAPRIEQVLQGKTSGVSVVSSSGAPGSGAKIRIRGAGSNGNSDPLYIVDGIKVSSIDNISPNDIANIEVLKDAASSAIYGTQGANGVIIVTTKQGKVGETVVTYSTQIGTQSVRTDMELMNASQFVTYFQEAGQTQVVDNGINTNWIDETFRNAFTQRHDLSISGANEKTSFYFSGSYINQEGVVGNDSDYTRFTGRLNVKSQVKSWLEVGTNITYSNIASSPITEDDSTGGVINHALLIDPLTPVIYTGALPQIAIDGVANGTAMVDEDGNVYGYPTYATGEVTNPVASANFRFRGGIDTDKVLASVYAKLKFSDNFNFTSRFGYERSNTFDNRWTPIYVVSSEAQNTSVTLNNAISRNSRWLWENFLSYSKEFGNHNLTGLLGYSSEQVLSPSYTLRGSDVHEQTDEFAYFDYSNRDNDVIGGGIYERVGTSVFGRLSYDYAGKYLLEGSLRYDTSSFFPTDKKSGYFPAISAGWVLSNEEFWSSDSKLNYAKLRGSWGQNGSDNNLGTYISSLVFQTVAEESGAVPVVPVVYEGVSGITAGNLPNPDLTWERSEQLDLGLDIRALNNNLNFSVDYYIKTTRDLILPDGDIIAPPSLGVGVPSINAGTVENKGFEFELGYNNSTEGGFSYGVNLNLSTLKNEVTEINFVGEDGFIIGAGAPQNNDGITRFQKGSPLWYFHGYKTDGIDADTGEIIFVDTDGVDGITSNDKTEIGSPHPDVIYGGSIDLGYKNFDFSLRFQGTQGNDIFAAYHQPSRPVTNKPIEFFNGRWQQVGDEALYPSAANATTAYDTDLVVQDGSYMRIKQIQLGYSFPSEVINKLRFKRLRTYVSLDDYFTFTKYNGLDPEAGSFSDNSIGVDRGFYPIPSKILLGLSIEF